MIIKDSHGDTGIKAKKLSFLSQKNGDHLSEKAPGYRNDSNKNNLCINPYRLSQRKILNSPTIEKHIVGSAHTTHFHFPLPSLYSQQRQENF